jgi:hypothetical protein
MELKHSNLFIFLKYLLVFMPLIVFVVLFIILRNIGYQG